MKKVFICIISNKLSSIEEGQLKDTIKESFGLFEEIEKEDSWEAPKEYTDEMGVGLKTKLYLFEKPKTNEDIENLKSLCMGIEQSTSLEGKRIFNLNPGFLSDEGMFLLSHKPSPQRGRIPFGKYWIEKQYDIEQNTGNYIIKPNTFSEYFIYLSDLQKVVK